jgi:uncharacterized protein YqjF (DUF2071 family)
VASEQGEGGEVSCRQSRGSKAATANATAPFDHYLTARWQLYTTLGPVLARSNVEHEPWPLHRAVVRELDGNLVAAAGLPAPHGEPVVHWSPGVRTRISGLRPLRRA